MVNLSVRAKVRDRSERRSMHHKTNGGVSDTDANELTVMPMAGRSPLSVVTTATPVGKQPSASRNARVSNSIGTTG